MKETSNKKLLLKNAKIYNGGTDDAFIGDVLVQGDRIVEVASTITTDDECDIIKSQKKGD